MLCENCNKAVATTHLSGWETVEVAAAQERLTIEHHFCQACVSELSQSSRLLNPLLHAAPGARRLRLRVESVSDSRIQVRAIDTMAEFRQDRWTFVASRLPAQYAVLGMEFDIIVTEEQLQSLQRE